MNFICDVIPLGDCEESCTKLFDIVKKECIAEKDGKYAVNADDKTGIDVKAEEITPCGYKIIECFNGKDGNKFQIIENSLKGKYLMTTIVGSLAFVTGLSAGIVICKMSCNKDKDAKSED